mgnify:CR=1 FL=1
MLAIGDLARRTGTKVQTIRYYEDIGLLAKPARTEGGQRRYDAAALDRLAFIRHARELGFGLDAVRAAAEGRIESVTMVTRKPPRGLMGAPYLEQNGIFLEGLNEAKLIFDGSARDGAKGFPANVNVAAALSLAGIGPDRTRLQIWADPAVTRNTHRIEVEADSARFAMSIENVPSEENPKTGRITALSAIACLRGLVAPMRVGT